MVQIDCNSLTTREINKKLREFSEGSEVELLNPDGRHNLAVGLEHKIHLTIHGHGGYYYGGMNKEAEITLNGNSGPGVAENMMSGTVRIKGYASTSAGASGHGGLLVIEKDTSLRCGISLKGSDIVVRGSVGNMCAFMAQAGNILIGEDAGHALGDSLYETVIYLGGTYKSLGADAKEEALADDDITIIKGLLQRANFNDLKPENFKKIVSAKTLYHFDSQKKQDY
jgi:glutamate synthase domain-containing protein 3